MVRPKLVKARSLSFGTKAETLEQLSGKLKNGQLLPLYYFSVKEWQADAGAVLQKLASNPWAQGKLIVRSSAHNEDTNHSSMAGAFTSRPDIQGEKALKEAITEVIASYSSSSPNDQVLIQPMLSEVVLAGVAFGCDPNTGAPYRVINYDNTSGQSNHVTSGEGSELKTSYVCRSAPSPAEGTIAQVVALLNELRGII